MHHPATAVCAFFVVLYIADGLWKPALLRGPMVCFWAYDFLAWVALPLLALLALHSATSLSARDYGLSAPPGWKDIASGMPLPLLALFLVNMFAYGTALELLGYRKPDFSYITALQSLGSLWIVGTVYLAATAGLWESIFYIGLPWLCLTRNGNTSAWARRGFILISSVLFAAAHLENGLANAIGALFFQLVAVSWYLSLRTLWPIIGAHALIEVYYLWPWAWVRT
jgi:membrane protease YdiL (CAAX protease family)